MSPRRRRHSVCALLLALVPFAFVLVVPAAACGFSVGASRQASTMDCCPPGSHPPGQCPLHRSAMRQGECRTTCSHQDATAFVPGLIAVLPAVTVVPAPLTIASPLIAGADVPHSRTIDQIVPPPKVRS